MSDDPPEHTDGQPEEKAKPVCGLVMPISTIDGLSEAHWREVRSIIEEAIGVAEFTPRLVSEADEIGTIHKRIVQNLYELPIVVCDVSARNPNVMTELGIRLAFDKPTVIVKDNETPYSFDTQVIEHIPYPRDLRYQGIVQFKKVLAAKVRATAEQAKKDSDYSPFLKHFGTFTVAKLDTKEVSKDEYILEQISEVKSLLRRLVPGPEGVTMATELRNVELAELIINAYDFYRANEKEFPREDLMRQLRTLAIVADPRVVGVSMPHFEKVARACLASRGESSFSRTSSTTATTSTPPPQAGE